MLPWVNNQLEQSLNENHTFANYFPLGRLIEMEIRLLYNFTGNTSQLCLLCYCCGESRYVLSVTYSIFCYLTLNVTINIVL